MKTNKFIRTITAAVLCLSALSVQAFAEDILTYKSIYAENGGELTKDIDPAACEKFARGKVSIDADSVTPLYTADFMEYARTGEFTVELKGQKDNEKCYIANGKDTDGNIKGAFEFYVGAEYSGITGYENGHIDFQSDVKRIKEAMTSKGISTDCKEIKLVFVEKVGYVYYIDNGESKYLASTGVGEKDEKIFSGKNADVIEISAELKEFADKELNRIEQEKIYQEHLERGENPPTGGNDNPPTAGSDENPETGMADAAVALAIGAAIAAGGIVVSAAGSRKNKR